MQCHVSCYSPLQACIALACRWHLGVCTSINLRKMPNINILDSTLRELVCKLLEPLTCSKIVSFMDVILTAANMISTALCNHRVPMSGPQIRTVRYNDARELTECIVYDKLYIRAESL